MQNKNIQSKQQINYLPRETVICDICQSSESQVVCEVPSFYSDERFTLVRCKQCSLIYVNPRQQEAAKLKNLEKVSEGAVFEHMQERDEEVFRQILNTIQPYCPMGTLMDIGCASGGLLRAASNRGYTVAGVEINQHAVQYAVQHYNLNVQCGTLETTQWKDESFDIVIMVNAIEHLYHPSQTVSHIQRILKPGGFFFCMTPDFNHYATRAAQVFGLMKDADRIDPTGHPYHFTPPTLAELIRRQGFQIIRCGSPISGLFTQRSSAKSWKKQLVRSLATPVIYLSRTIPIGSTIQCIAKRT